MKVLINDGKGGDRKVVEAELVRRNQSTVIVRLPDGHIISRKMKRDVPEEKG